MKIYKLVMKERVNVFVVCVFIVIYGFLCFNITIQKLKHDVFLIIAMERDERKTEEKAIHDIKAELLGRVDIEKKDETGLDDAARNAKVTIEAVTLIRGIQGAFKRVK